MLAILIRTFQSRESLGNGLAGSSPHLGDVLAGQSVLVLDLHLVDLVSTDLLLLQRVHQVDLH